MSKIPESEPQNGVRRDIISVSPDCDRTSRERNQKNPARRPCPCLSLFARPVRCVDRRGCAIYRLQPGSMHPSSGCRVPRRPEWWRSRQGAISVPDPSQIDAFVLNPKPHEQNPHREATPGAVTISSRAAATDGVSPALAPPADRTRTSARPAPGGAPPTGERTAWPRASSGSRARRSWRSRHR